MRFTTLVLGGAFALCTSMALAADDPMATTYANTVTSKNTKTGATAALLFNADGTYITRVTGQDGKPMDIPGKWATKDSGATLCLTQQAGSSPPTESCSPLSVHPIGEHWTVTNTAGDSFDVVVTAGR
ncbi:MAG: hypothetical protein ISS15_17980 [Alphaproteobacteria bacterium]|nr:hypothetical protein [Alphaproteobacteria bacterium]MBL6938959.1 hypothetical protein [Alphaproteobacteria bacterium]MBL7099551.1 hypothetical protein [Alphaproteobacteria bacterium]